MPETMVGEFARRTGMNIAYELIKLLLVWGWPFILAALAIVAGYFQNVPWFYVVIGTAVTFAAAATGALRFSEMLARITAANKLYFGGFVPAMDPIKDKKTGLIKSLDKIQLCLVLQNNAHFPISFVVEEYTTSFEGMINSKSKRDADGAIIPPGTPMWFRDCTIDLKNMPLDKANFEGHAKFKLRYGHAGREHHRIERDCTLMIVIDPKSGAAQIHAADVVKQPR